MFNFTKASRIRNKNDFKNVFQKSLLFKSGPLILRAHFRNDNNISRLGMAISKKIVRKAVYRNKIKRHCREFFRKNINTVLYLGWDFVVYLNFHYKKQLLNGNFDILDFCKLWNIYSKYIEANNYKF